MLRRHPPAVACRGVIVCCLRFVAPVAANLEVGVVVRAAVLKRNDVLDVPIVSRGQLALADVAATAARLENGGPPLRRHRSALGVLKGMHQYPREGVVSARWTLQPLYSRWRKQSS